MKRMMMLALAVAFGLSLPGAVQAQGYQVVVNAANGVSEMSKDDVSKVFLKKSHKFPGGGDAVAVDQDASGSVREGFSQAVHGRSASAIESHWQQQIFAGKDVPPEVLKTDAAVLDYVRANPGAIGYVSAGASLGSGVKAITVSGT